MPIMIKDHRGTEHDAEKFPQASLIGLVNRGFNHVLGNEVAAQVTQKIRSHLAETSNPKRKADSKSVPTTEVSAFRDANPKMVQAWAEEFADAKVAAILAGELGVRTAGTAVDPLTREMLSIARQEIKDIFRKQGWVFPTKADETFDLGGTAMTGDELVERWLNGQDKAGTYGEANAQNKPRIEREATRSLKAKVAKRDAVSKSSVAGGDVAASLGL